MPLIVQILIWLINAYILVLFVRAVLSWFGPDPRNPVIAFLDRLTDPMLEPIRRVLGMRGPIDFSPLVAIIVLMLIRNLLGRIS